MMVTLESFIPDREHPPEGRWIRGFTSDKTPEEIQEIDVWIEMHHKGKMRQHYDPTQLDNVAKETQQLDNLFDL